MKKLYEVEIEATVQGVVFVAADSEAEAKDLAAEWRLNGFGEQLVGSYFADCSSENGDYIELEVPAQMDWIVVSTTHLSSDAIEITEEMIEEFFGDESGIDNPRL